MPAYVVMRRNDRQQFFGNIQKKVEGLGHHGRAQLRKFSGGTERDLGRWERGTHLATTDTVGKFMKGFKEKPGNSFMVYDASGKFLGKGMTGMIRAKSTQSAWKSGGEHHWGAPSSTPWAERATPPRMGSGGMRTRDLKHVAISSHPSTASSLHFAHTNAPHVSTSTPHMGGAVHMTAPSAHLRSLL